VRAFFGTGSVREERGIREGNGSFSSRFNEERKNAFLMCEIKFVVTRHVVIKPKGETLQLQFVFQGKYFFYDFGLQP